MKAQGQALRQLVTDIAGKSSFSLNMSKPCREFAAAHPAPAQHITLLFPLPCGNEGVPDA